ncbi:MAG: hypothetical protein RJA52_670 [Bacteroidota bacterium]|jgi:aminopeptidase
MRVKNGSIKKYAELLVQYCLNLKEGEKILIQSSTLAEDLVSAVYKECLKIGAYPEIQFEFKGKEEAFSKFSNENTIQHIPLLTKVAFEQFDACLFIRAPFDQGKKIKKTHLEKLRREAMEPHWENYFRRTGTGELKRCLCQYPTLSGAKDAGMSINEFQKFVLHACKLNEKDPIQAWKKLGENQKELVEFLNSKTSYRFKNKKSDISFSTKERIWINSDGKSNMPSGEVFTSPVENSVEGEIYFDFPFIHEGYEIKGVKLEVINGIIEKWKVQKGQKAFDRLMDIPGARIFGEAAIGTNYGIKKSIKNILFDEKIGGTIHMAIGQSYAQAGGQNKSIIHLDLIADMTNGGLIYADNEIIYENGKFLGFFL